MDTSDLETQPIFTSKGGLRRPRKIFGAQLDSLIERLNYTVPHERVLVVVRPLSSRPKVS